MKPPDKLIGELRSLVGEATHLSLRDRIRIYNEAVKMVAGLVGLPHPVLSPQLVPIDSVKGNEYNPNVVAPPEMRLLKHSIRRDGVTMAVVVAPDPETPGGSIVVDGFHRTSIVKSEKDVQESLAGYLPVVQLDKDITELMASTVRHNMARGSHMVELSAKLVTVLTKHHWTDEKIGQELGMDPDEVLRLKQITGLADAFADRDFSEAWG